MPIVYATKAARIPSLRLPHGIDAADRVVALHFRAAEPYDDVEPFKTVTAALGGTAVVLLLKDNAMKRRVEAELSVLLADASITKVVFRAAPAAQRLQSWLGATMRFRAVNIVDLALALDDAAVASDPIAQALANQCRDISNAHYDAMRERVAIDPGAWFKPIIAGPLVQYVANQAGMCLALYGHLAKRYSVPADSTGQGLLARLMSLTAQQWGQTTGLQRIVELLPPVTTNNNTSNGVMPALRSTATEYAFAPPLPSVPAPPLPPGPQPPLPPSPVPPSAASVPPAPVPPAPVSVSVPVPVSRPQPLPPASVQTVPPATSSASAVSPHTTGAITYIATTAELESLLACRNFQLFDAAETPTVALHVYTQRKSDSESESESELVALAFTGRSATGATTDTVVLHLLPTLDRSAVATSVAQLLLDDAVTTVAFAIHTVAYALSTWRMPPAAAALEPTRCVDLQLAFEHLVDTRTGRTADLAHVAAHCSVPFARATYCDALQSAATRLESDTNLSLSLTKTQLQMLQRATFVLLACFDALLLRDNATAAAAATTQHNVSLVAAMTTRRWQNAIANGGVPALWFDATDDFMPRSLECLECLTDSTNDAASSDDDNTLVPALQLECDLAPLLALLPAKFRDPIVALDGLVDALVDICLDVGRVPHVYVGKGQRIALSVQPDDASDDASCADNPNSGLSTLATVTHDDIHDVLERLGGPHKIGFDNRAGLDRQLHRVSVMRNKTGDVYGLTLRVGRAVRYAANVLSDVLHSAAHCDKSVLLLGRPGAGKTTLLRDVARSVAAAGANVCIIDTSNEIGGDGNVPHACIGWARRMMVPTLEQQASVMVECVQNHTVETLVIDEIGRKAEVLAASTVRQRGPRLIASGHGDLRSLIRNPELRGLVGGVQQVTIGDAAAAASAFKSKLQTQRAGAPIFDIVVELDHAIRGRCRIVWDVADAVDAVLRGDCAFAAEVRLQRIGARGILQSQSWDE